MGRWNTNVLYIVKLDLLKCLMVDGKVKRYVVHDSAYLRDKRGYKLRQCGTLFQICNYWLPTGALYVAKL